MDTGYLRLHVRVLWEPAVPALTMVSAMQQVYDTAAIRINLVSMEGLSVPGVNPDCFPVGACDTPGGTDLTPAQALLFSHRDTALQDDVIAYLVRSMDGGQEGCSTHPQGSPCVTLSSLADAWTLGHEIGHVLGLEHVASSDYLMYRYGTSDLTRTPPLLSDDEIAQMRSSPLVSHAPASLSDVRSTVLSHAPLAERLRQLPAEADEALSALAEDKNPVVASKAVFVASHRQTTSAGAVVRKGLCHPLPHVRLVAAAALQRIAPSQWGDLRKAIATERDTGVRQLLRQTLKGRAESSLATTKENG